MMYIETMTLIPTILFILIFGFIVFVHEFGHFWVAKREGMIVKEFALGFPPRLFSWIKNKTRYSLNLLPLGGYVSILGENEEINQKGSFSSAKPWARFRVSMAGIFMNVVLAWILLTIWFWIMPSQNNSNTIIVSQVLSGSPAEKANIKPNDFILGSQDKIFATSKELTDYTNDNKGKEVVLKIRRNGNQIEQKIKLSDDKAPLGVAVADLDSFRPDVPWYKAPWYAILELGYLTIATFSFFGSLVLGLIGLGKEVSTEAVSGPVGIYMHLQQISTLGFASVLRFSAFISMAIAIFNFLPFPALDGGRAMFILIEALMGKKIISHQKEGIIHAVGFGILILLMLVVTFMDIKKL